MVARQASAPAGSGGNARTSPEKRLRNACREFYSALLNLGQESDPLVHLFCKRYDPDARRILPRWLDWSSKSELGNCDSGEGTMREISLLARSKETDRKLRWAAEVDDGAVFELYIPKEQVPEPWPGRIYVEIWGPDDTPQPRTSVRQSNNEAIVEAVRWVRNHTKTARYRPLGDSSTWQLGEPYIPYALLPDPPPSQVLLKVRWDQSTPWKSTV